MSLDNLVGISLEKITPDRAMIGRLLAAAERNIADAQVTAISDENRFDAAYKAIMQLSNAALQAHGYRTPTSKLGHHMTMIQTLDTTIGLDKKTMVALDGLRKQRHDGDYSGAMVTAAALEACIAHAQALQGEVTRWLKANKPELMAK